MYIEKKMLKIYISYWLATMFWIVSIMIIVGGLTRLTDSGLSITEWELFSGFLPPLNEAQWDVYFNLYKEIPEYKLQNYLMTLEAFKLIFWWEFVHRFLGRLVGLLFIKPLIYFSLKLGINRTKNLFTIFILICLQGFIGWYMVSSGLINRVDVSHYRLSLHLVLAFVILSLIFWNYLKYKGINHSGKKINLSLPIIFLLLIFLQISIGAFVSGMDAGKIYNSWPLMGFSYFPDDNSIINLFKLEAFNDPSLVQFMHRNLAYLIFIFYLLILFIVYKNNLLNLFQAAKIIGFILIAQIVLGVLTLLSGAQIIVSSMHQISSIFLVSSSIYLVYLNLNTNLQLSD
jgi:cytochrome c oxidase assembly protein subunit 15